MWCKIRSAPDHGRALVANGRARARARSASPRVLSPSPLHACVTRLVDNDRLPGLVNVMVHAEVGSYPVQQHPVVRGHLRELLKLIAGNREESSTI